MKDEEQVARQATPTRKMRRRPKRKARSNTTKGMSIRLIAIIGMIIVLFLMMMLRRF